MRFNHQKATGHDVLRINYWGLCSLPSVNLHVQRNLKKTTVSRAFELMQTSFKCIFAVLLKYARGYGRGLDKNAA